VRLRLRAHRGQLRAARRATTRVRRRLERVERLMKRWYLLPRKRGRTTIRVPGVPFADDLVERHFGPAALRVST
jgi:hypothetical protein